MCIRDRYSLQANPSMMNAANKKRKTTITDITHISVEKLKKSMERHIYEVKVIDENFFHGPRDLEASFEMVVSEVVDAVLKDLEYDSTRMRVGINFTFGDDQSPDRKYYVNISYRDILDNIAVKEMMRRMEGSFQSGDKATFTKFKVVATVFMIAKGKGNDCKTDAFEPQNLTFKHRYISKVHLEEGAVGCAFKAVVLFRKIARECVESRGIHSYTIEKEAEALAKKCGMEYTDSFIVTDFEKIENIEKCRIVVFGPDGNGVKILYNPSNAVSYTHLTL